MINKIFNKYEKEEAPYVEQHIKQQTSDYHEWDNNQSFSDTINAQQKLQDQDIDILKKDLDVSINEIPVANLRQLLKNKNYDAIKEYISQNDVLRASFHEAAHIIVWKKWSPKNIIINTVSLWEQNNNATTWIQKKIDGISSWRVEWGNFFSFTDQHFVQLAIAWYALERLFGISHENAAAHAKQDFYDIINRVWYDHIYENWRKPSHFNEKGDLVCTEVTPILSPQEIKDALIKITYAELQSTWQILAANRDALYAVWIELFSEKSLDNTSINTLLAI